MNRALLIIAKRPAAGQTKTRLSPPLWPQAAASLYECFLLDMLDTIRSVASVSRLLYYWPPEGADYFGQLAPDFGLIPQQGESLGERLDFVLTHCLTTGFDQVAITNSDSPNLPAAYLTEAFHRLEQADVVLGPSEDGGYYLIGLTAPQPRLVREVEMSTPTVLQDTLALAGAENLKTALLPPWYDVDTVAELERLAHDLHHSDPTTSPRTRRFLQSAVDFMGSP